MASTNQNCLFQKHEFFDTQELSEPATHTKTSCDHYRVDVSQRDKLGAIGVAKAEQEMKVLLEIYTYTILLS